MRSRLQQLTFATERLVAGIRDGSVRHDGGTLLRRHVLNARRRPNRWGISFGKERRDSPRKVDAFAALQLADMARADFVTAESKTKKRTGNVW
jgi:phage terminase large subunit-like protein